MTKGERTLAEGDQSEAVLQMRGTFQRMMRQEACAAIEELTGRRVIAFMSDNHIQPDVARSTLDRTRPVSRPSGGRQGLGARARG